jgi:hypothetical protein
MNAWQEILFSCFGAVTIDCLLAIGRKSKTYWIDIDISQPAGLTRCCLNLTPRFFIANLPRSILTDSGCSKL